MKKVKFISKHHIMKCWGCEGTGKQFNKQNKSVKCKICKGSKKFVEPYYILVYNLKGQRIAFGVSSLK